MKVFGSVWNSLFRLVVSNYVHNLWQFERNSYCVSFKLWCSHTNGPLQ
jgi:hypothetical protein